MQDHTYTPPSSRAAYKKFYLKLDLVPVLSSVVKLAIKHSLQLQTNSAGGTSKKIIKEFLVMSGRGRAVRAQASGRSLVAPLEFGSSLVVKLHHEKSPT
jgi:hypothetical protein